MKKWRQYLSSAGITAGVLVLGAAAFAAPALVKAAQSGNDDQQGDEVAAVSTPTPSHTPSAEPSPRHRPEVEASESPEVEASESPEVEASESPEVEASESPEADEKDSEGSEVVNHGHCVSFAVHYARDTLDLEGRAFGEFVSTVAQDPTAVSKKVEEGGKPDAACMAAIVKASAKATATPAPSASPKGEPNEQHEHISDHKAPNNHGDKEGLESS